MTIQFATEPKPNGIAARAIATLSTGSLTAIVNGTVNHLTTARGAAEILDGLRKSSFAYAEVKAAGRMAKAKGAHDEFLASVHRAQADLLDAEASAKRRLADEYDAAQERGEVARNGGDRTRLPDQNSASVADIGLTHKDIHEARQFRDAEAADPGLTRRTLDAKLAAGEEPTKAALREAVIEAARQGIRGAPSPSNRNPLYQTPTAAGEAWTKLYGTCRAMSEWATDENIALAIRGRSERSDDQASNIRVVRRAAEILSEIVGKIDAH